MYTYFGGGPMWSIRPKEGLQEKVYDILKNASEHHKHFKVFLKEEIPDRFHYKHNRRINPIMLLADEGYG